MAGRAPSNRCVPLFLGAPLRRSHEAQSDVVPVGESAVADVRRPGIVRLPCLALVTAVQGSAAGESGHCPLGNPAVAAQPPRGLDASAGDVMADARPGGDPRGQGVRAPGTAHRAGREDRKRHRSARCSASPARPGTGWTKKSEQSASGGAKVLRRTSCELPSHGPPRSPWSAAPAAGPQAPASPDRHRPDNQTAPLETPTCRRDREPDGARL